MISLIIVDYKSISKTLAYIQSCYEHILDTDQMHVIIVDNNEDVTAGMKEISKIIGYEMLNFPYREYSRMYMKEKWTTTHSFMYAQEKIWDMRKAIT